MPDHSALDARLTNLEMLFMHLDETVKELDTVVVAQQKRLDSLAARIAALSEQSEDKATDVDGDEPI
jgi:uncharacterized coiled-coil protein SlyX